jgi:nicotinamidase-related amidase
MPKVTRREFGRGVVVTAAAASAVAVSGATPAQNSPSSSSAKESVMDRYVKFTSDSCCLLMVDFQSGIANVTHSIPMKDVVQNALTMLAIAQVLKIPVVFTSSEEDSPRKGLIFDELAKAAPEAYADRIRRHGIVDAFDDQSFQDAVRRTSRKNIVIGGISTEECVSLPALSGCNLGYNVKVIADACASYSPYTDTIQFNRMLHYGVDVTTVRQFVAEMVGSWARPEAAQINHLSIEWGRSLELSPFFHSATSRVPG